MRIFNESTIKRYARENPETRAVLSLWLRETRAARWASPADVKALYAHASIINNDRVVFNILGNSYRLIVSLDWARGRLFVRFLGTHAEYNHVDARTV